MIHVFSMAICPNFTNFIEANDDTGRDYLNCSAEGASNAIANLSGKKTLV